MVPTDIKSVWQKALKENMLAQKIEICKIKSTNSTIKNVELASRYGVGESTINDILKKQHHYLSLSPNNYITNLCREKPSKYPTVEQALALWIDQVVDGNPIWTYRYSKSCDIRTAPRHTKF